MSRDNIHLDGVDDLYMNYLDRLLDDIEQRLRVMRSIGRRLGRLATSLSRSSSALPPEEDRHRNPSLYRAAISRHLWLPFFALLSSTGTPVPI